MSISINGKYRRKEFVKSFRSHYDDFLDFFDEETGSVIKNDPFRVCILPNFIECKEEVLDYTKIGEVIKGIVREMSNDLHDHNQSCDLQSMKFTKKDSALGGIISLFCGKDMRMFMENITGSKLRDEISICAQMYKKSNYLLCHDDSCEGRIIAYILYLVDSDWEHKHGGTLDLYNIDSEGNPDKITRSISPRKNTMVFFEVTPVSFHQVSEVLGPKNRFSVCGWFYGPSMNHDKEEFIKSHYRQQEDSGVKTETTVSKLSCEIRESQDFSRYIHTCYSSIAFHRKSNNMFCENGIVVLYSFIKPDMFKSVVCKIIHEDIFLMTGVQDRVENDDWVLEGPANYRKYLKHRGDTKLSRGLWSLFDPSSILDYVGLITGVEMKLKSNEILLFGPGDYILLHDNFVTKENQILVFYIVLLDKELEVWEESFGGTILHVYGDEVSTTTPQTNTLIVMKNTEDIQMAITYIKKSLCQSEFMCLTLSYSY